MRFLVLLGFISLAFARKTFFGDQVLTIKVDNEAQVQTIKELEPKVDFWNPESADHIKPGVSADIRIPSELLPAVKVLLRREKIQFEVKIEDVESLVAAQFQSKANRAILDGGAYNYYTYHTYEEINAWTDEIAATHSGVVTKFVLGKSFEGRDIPMLKLSTNDANPIILVDCGIHAREWISPAFCQCYVNELLTGSTSSQAHLNDVTYYIIPSLNVDGYSYTWTNDRMWRKTRSTGHNGVCVGVDPNRNWDAGFGGEGSSNKPCSDVYHGPVAESEPEVKALANFMRDNVANIKAYITFHAYGQYLIYPYSYTTNLAADNDMLDNYAAQGASAIRSVHGKRFTYGPGAVLLYPAAGGSDDYAYDAGIKLSYTPELRDKGAYGFTLPESQIQPVCEEMTAYMDVMYNAVMAQ